MNEIYAVLGFFLLLGLLILRMIEEQRRAAPRTKLEVASTAHFVEGRTTADRTFETRSSSASRSALQRTT